MAFATRLADSSDYPTFARLFPELRVPDPLPDAEHFDRHMLPRVLLACEGNQAVGYAFWQVYGATAHIVHLVVDPRTRGRGVGQALFAALRSELGRAGCARMYLNVKRDNLPALHLYERAGLRVEHETWVMRIAWRDLERLVDSPGCVAQLLERCDDHEIAARFAIPEQRIGLLRGRESVVLLGVRESGQWVAFTAFDAAVPIAYPFRVARCALARPLLHACREHADATRFDFMHLNVEGDAELKGALIAAGAEVAFEILQMGASL